MMLRITETVEREPFLGTTADDHGNAIETWGAPAPVGIYAFNPGTTGDSQESGHDRDISTPSIYVPSDVVMDPRDRVIVRGKTYEVDGDTLEFRNPFSSLMDGNQIKLRKVAG